MLTLSASRAYNHWDKELLKKLSLQLFLLEEWILMEGNLEWIQYMDHSTLAGGHSYKAAPCKAHMDGLMIIFEEEGC